MIAEINRTTPIGLFNYGASFLAAAGVLAAKRVRPNFSAPCEFLAAHGLELVFKADLARSQSIDDIRKQFGHDLQRLFESVGSDFKAKFGCGAEFGEVVDFLAIGHSPPYENRYIVTGYRSVIEPIEFMKHLVPFSNVERSWLVSHFGDGL